jgi:hypothetical protein
MVFRREGAGSRAGGLRSWLGLFALLVVAAGSDGGAVRGQSLAAVPGTVVRSLPVPPSLFGTFAGSPKVYTTSPSIVVLPNGDYVIADNDFGGDSSAGTSGVTNVFRSTDRGATWTQSATLTDMKRGSLFVHGDALHIIGYTNSTGSDALTVIRRSTDGGVTWGPQPSNRDNGLFGNGSAGTPNAPVVHDGRLWVAQAGKRVRSVPATTANLLATRQWTRSSTADTEAGPFGPGLTISEAQIVASPRTGVVVMPKIERLNTGVLLRVDPTDPSRMLNPSASDWIALPGGEKKFAARYDPVSDRFWVLSNPVLPVHADYRALAGDGSRDVRPWLVRNTAALVSSRDLMHWDVERIFLYSPNIDSEAFQYLQFDFDGEDLVVVARTAFDVGGNTPLRGHDSNLTTFHRIPDFRTATARHVIEMVDGTVQRHELTQHAPAPFGSFTQGSAFAGLPLTDPVGLGQAADGDVYIGERAGRVLQFDALGNFRAVVDVAPVELSDGPLILAPPAPGLRGWVRSEGGSWADIMHWHSWNRPDTAAETVVLGSAIDAAATLTIDEAVTVKGMVFRSDFAYTLAGTGTLRLEADAGRSILHVERGDHRIDVPLVLGGDLDLATEASGGLMLGGLMNLAGRTLEISGSGEVVLSGGILGPGALTGDGTVGGPLVFGAGMTLAPGPPSPTVASAAAAEVATVPEPAAGLLVACGVAAACGAGSRGRRLPGRRPTRRPVGRTLRGMSIGMLAAGLLLPVAAGAAETADAVTYGGDVTAVRVVRRVEEHPSAWRIWQPFIAPWKKRHLVVAYGAMLAGKKDMGDVLASVSTDDGDTWQAPVPVFDHAVRQGTVQFAYANPVLYRPPDQDVIWCFAMRCPIAARNSEESGLCAAYTADGGRSWIPVELAMQYTGPVITNAGLVETVIDGRRRYLLPAHRNTLASDPRGSRDHFILSSSNLLEWRLEAFIPQPETARVFLHEGHLAPGDAPGEFTLVMRTANYDDESRTTDPPRAYSSDTRDGGRSWTPAREEPDLYNAKSKGFFGRMAAGGLIYVYNDGPPQKEPGGRMALRYKLRPPGGDWGPERSFFDAGIKNSYPTLVEVAPGDFRAVWDSGTADTPRTTIRFGKLRVDP